MPVQLRNLTVVAALGALLSACGGRSSGGGGQVLNVWNWSDYIEPSLLEQFEAETGIKVNYEVGDSNEMLETKLLAGRTGYDVVVPSASFMARQIQAGIFQKLDRSKLSNYGNLDPAIQKNLAALDPGNEYSVNYMWGTSGIAYIPERINEAMPNAPVDSFAMFYDPDVVKNFERCGVSILDAPSEVVGTVLIYLGKDANSESLEDLRAAEEVLMKIRPYIRTIDSSAYIDHLANGERCLVLGWSGDVFQAKARAEEAGKPFTVEYNIPKEGAVQFFDQLAIPADAANVDNAHKFIDFLLRADVAAKNTNYIQFANGNLASFELIDEEVRNNPSIYPPPEVAAKLVPDTPESPEFTRELTRTWTRFKTGR
ncbi:MAG: polyamine ABC transporter substrate-binding protein [Pseudomonadota bacterium]|jgi:putrescine transport system substrate-binding protein